MPFNSSSNNITTTPRSNWSGGYISTGLTQNISTVFPTIGNNFPFASGNSITTNPLPNAAKMSKGHISNANPFIFPSDQIGGPQTYNTMSPDTTNITACMTKNGYANNFRS